MPRKQGIHVFSVSFGTKERKEELINKFKELRELTGKPNNGLIFDAVDLMIADIKTTRDALRKAAENETD